MANNTTLVKSPLKRVVFTDFLKRYDEKGLLGMENERMVRQSLYSICTLIHDYLTESGRHAFLSLSLIIEDKLSQDEVEALRIDVWEGSEKLLIGDTRGYNAMKALLCSLYDSSVHRNSYYDVVNSCIKFSLAVLPDTEEKLINILREHFESTQDN